ncbi:hypothetical protein [Methanobrevibacter sp.]|uniref:hypothetical protein n=1 Tax=Methanobrevibacter sp. TaxID=66852 RepID=UPI0026DFF781|nr:hypothetical protein [Methanobrevibacter sp.]MDO5859177.1 hypothetical protein [Methanobrevibacter sp.]
MFKNFDKFNLNLEFISKTIVFFKKALFSLVNTVMGVFKSFDLQIILMISAAVFDFNNRTVGISYHMAMLNRIPYLNRVIGAK